MTLTEDYTPNWINLKDHPDKPVGFVDLWCKKWDQNTGEFEYIRIPNAYWNKWSDFWQVKTGENGDGVDLGELKDLYPGYYVTHYAAIMNGPDGQTENLFLSGD